MASSFDHPVRGTVHCPAAPLVSAWLDAHGTPNSIAPLTGLPSPTAPADSSDGRLAATTYLDLDGRAVGIAVLAPPPFADRAAAAVSVWTACLRTRRLVVPLLTPHCDGSLDALPRPRRSTAGSSSAGAECRPRADAREAVLGYQREHQTVLLLGTQHSRVDGPAPRAPGGVVPVRDEGEAAKVLVEDPRNVVFVVAPCADIRTVSAVLAVLRNRFPLLRGQHPDQWCYRSTDNRLAAGAAVRFSDLALAVEGAPPGIRQAGGVVAVGGLGDLRPEDIARAATISLIGPPVPRRHPAGPQVTDLIEVLSGLGPASVVHQRFISDVSTNVFDKAAQDR
ncbi:hypothetical protein [Kitasatospora cineracea]|uniref:hypothetical protein n=1 Tax=Kitasatospora cineracea TaxID=88074 RepID=UPI0037B0F60D